MRTVLPPVVVLLCTTPVIISCEEEVDRGDILVRMCVDNGVCLSTDSSVQHLKCARSTDGEHVPTFVTTLACRQSVRCDTVDNGRRARAVVTAITGKRGAEKATSNTSPATPATAGSKAWSEHAKRSEKVGRWSGAVPTFQPNPTRASSR